MNYAKNGISGNGFVVIFVIISVIILFSLLQEFKPVNTRLYQHVKIEQGDTLWSLADTYSEEFHKGHKQFISWVEQVNHISPEQLIPGQEIVIPVKL